MLQSFFTFIGAGIISTIISLVFTGIINGLLNDKETSYGLSLLITSFIYGGTLVLVLLG